MSGNPGPLLRRRLLRSLWHIKLRLGVLLLLIIIAGFTSLSMAEFTRNADRVYEDFYAETNLADVVVETGGWPVPRENLTAACDAATAAHVGTSLAVTRCETRLVLEGQYRNPHPEVEKWVRATLYGHEAGEGAVSGLWLTEGRMAAGPGEVVADAHMADDEKMETGIGDRLTVRVAGVELNLTVVGLANSPHHLYFLGNEQALMPLDGTYAVLYLDIATLTNATGLSVDARNQLLIDLQGTPAYDLQDTKEDEGAALRPLKGGFLDATLAQNLTNVQVFDRGGIYSVEVLRQDLEGSKKSTPFITVLASVINGFVLAISLDRLVRSQTREIGVLRALGLSGREIRNNYLLVPLGLGVVGATLSLPLGLLGANAWTNWYFGMLGVPVVETSHYPDLILGVWLAIVLITLLFGLRPALRAARLMPLEIMHDRPAGRPARRLGRLTARLPVTVGLGVRSSFRRPGRLGLTVAGLGVSMVVVGGSLLLMVSMLDYIHDGLDEAEAWDAQVIFMPQQESNLTNYSMALAEQEPELRNWTLAHAGEIEAEWALTVPGNASGDDRMFAVWGLDRFSEDGISMHVSRLTQGRLPRANQTLAEVVIDTGMAALLEWEPGDTVAVFIAGHPVEVRVVGVSKELGRSLWLHRGDLTAIMGVELVNVLFLRGDFAPGDLPDLEGLALVTYHYDMVEAFDTALEKYSGMIYIFIGVGAIIAVVVLVNTLVINLAERDSELATLRVLGASLRRLTGVLAVEHAIIGLLGGIIGAIAAMFAASLMVGLFTTWAFHFVLETQWSYVIALGLFVLIAALLTTFLGTWRIKRMDLLKKVQEFSR